MAGRARSFIRSKFKVPKYLIDIDNISILERALRGFARNNLEKFNQDDLHYYFVVQKDHFHRYNLRSVIDRVALGATILIADFPTDGQANTAMCASNKVGSDDPLVIVSPDQILNCKIGHYLDCCRVSDADVGMIVTDKVVCGSRLFKVNVDDNNNVLGVYDGKRKGAELIDCGVYYFKYGFYFTLFCKRMIARGVKMDGEFYVSQVLNDAVIAGKEVRAYRIKDAGLFHKPNDVRQFIKKSPQWIQ